MIIRHNNYWCTCYQKHNNSPLIPANLLSKTIKINSLKPSKQKYLKYSTSLKTLIKGGKFKFTIDDIKKLNNKTNAISILGVLSNYTNHSIKIKIKDLIKLGFKKSSVYSTIKYLKDINKIWIDKNGFLRIKKQQKKKTKQEYLYLKSKIDWILMLKTNLKQLFIIKKASFLQSQYKKSEHKIFITKKLFGNFSYDIIRKAFQTLALMYNEIPITQTVKKIVNGTWITNTYINKNVFF